MNDARSVVTLLAVGGLLGAIFFGGLWWTVRNALTTANPAAWLLGSSLVRMGAVLIGFYYVSGSGWPGILLCLCGLLIARVAVTRLTRPVAAAPHAP